ncbi:hypothetical protein QN386_22385 [Pseudomonas sp. CCI3.2]|uniref:hypothetical protein n=1 Tax=unclassified Pseudomonas TaxID=196821 RepID=UPI002B23BF41|nr:MULTISPECIES: hypothetical protein [unclassified Pseudomonas]MEB0078046.1 hypothetical protein [Pseudomonas sp. MH10out]MEB0104053.1 hypothetical protein [Pseudomonas sp. CCI3.2]
MTEQANRIDWLERQLAQVGQFIVRDKDVIGDGIPSFSQQIALSSWQAHQEELRQELRQAKAALQLEVVQLRLIGLRMDGSIPLKLLSKLSDFFDRAVSYAAYHLRHGVNPKRGIPVGLAKEIDLRLSDLAFGSTRLIFAGNVAPDTTGESIMEGALEQIFNVLAAPTHDRIRELVSVIGVPATKALSDMLGILEASELGAELSWPAPNAKVYHWGGSLGEVRNAHHKLSAHEDIKPEPTTLFGVVADLKENGTIYVRNGSSKQKVTYNKQQFQRIQKLSLGMPITLSVMKYVRYEPLSDREIVTYKMVTDD